MSYGYDNQNRLTSVTMPNTIGQINYAYGRDTLSEVRAASSTQGDNHA